MTNQQILTKAIRKAIDNGWDISKNDNLYSALYPVNQNIVQPEHIPLVIFNHDFAKSLFGEKQEIKSAIGEVLFRPYNSGWQYHLQMMVISPDPIKYLGENI